MTLMLCVLEKVTTFLPPHEKMIWSSKKYKFLGENINVKPTICYLLTPIDLDFPQNV